MLGIAVAIAISCGPAKPSDPPAAERPPPLRSGPIVGFVPAAGLRWLVVARLGELAQDVALDEKLAPLFPEHRLDAFAQRTGFDLRETPEALAAGFDFSVLYAGKTVGDNSPVETRFVERLLSGPRTVSSHPRVTRTIGVVGTTPQTLVRIHDDLVAVSVGDPTPARVVELFALGKLERTVPALSGSALKTLPKDLEEAPIRFYAPGPFDEEWGRAAHGLLAGALALGASAVPAGDALAVRIVLAGHWEGVQEPGHLLAAWRELTQSGLGRLLGLHRPIDGPQVDFTERHLELRIVVPLDPVVFGLRAAVAADVWEIMRFPGDPALAPAPPSTGPDAGAGSP